MNYSIEEILHIAADLQTFAHQPDEFDEIMMSSLSDELDIIELEHVAAARNTAPSYQSFRERALCKKK